MSVIKNISMDLPKPPKSVIVTEGNSLHIFAKDCINSISTPFCIRRTIQKDCLMIFLFGLLTFQRIAVVYTAILCRKHYDFKNSADYFVRTAESSYLAAISSILPSARSLAVISLTFAAASEPFLKPIPYSSTWRSSPSIIIRSA